MCVCDFLSPSPSLVWRQSYCPKLRAISCCFYKKVEKCFGHSLDYKRKWFSVSLSMRLLKKKIPWHVPWEG